MRPNFLVCGLEHTGTTLISDLFRQIPNLDSGFECGVLLCESPEAFQDYQPFADNMLGGWGITEDQFADCCSSKSFDQFYEKLFKASTVLEEGTAEFFDKTPRYLAQLSRVLERCDAPVIISYKDPRAIVCSDFKRAKTDDFAGWYEQYVKGKLRYASNCYAQYVEHKDDPRVAIIGLEDLAMNARATMERMFAHVGQAFRLEYSIIETLRYENVKNHTVSADIAFEYKRILSKDAQSKIREDFAHLDAWFYD
ncbi:sulfotransferase [Roseovarius sp. MMSF_3281]|uniref:sulfotransferase n=1 Tax=Roseovarius sp. MMSF_3281 TaxID=3046694 RepID=UPI00273D3AE9|nr:sulfotransferase [Roseovarius sp. MMSF_3281]